MLTEPEKRRHRLFAWRAVTHNPSVLWLSAWAAVNILCLTIDPLFLNALALGLCAAGAIHSGIEAYQEAIVFSVIAETLETMETERSKENAESPDTH